MKYLLMFAWFVAACASSPKPEARNGQSGQSGQGSGSNMVCHEVADTGTLFSHTECHPIDDDNARRDSDQRAVKTLEGNQAPTMHH